MMWLWLWLWPLMPLMLWLMPWLRPEAVVIGEPGRAPNVGGAIGTAASSTGAPAGAAAADSMMVVSDSRNFRGRSMMSQEWTQSWLTRQ